MSIDLFVLYALIVNFFETAQEKQFTVYSVAEDAAKWPKTIVP